VFSNGAEYREHSESLRVRKLITSLAATIFQVFVASDTASETLVNLKRIHGLMPYFVLKGILKVSNPMAMIRGQLAGLMRAQADVRRPRPLPCATVRRSISRAKVRLRNVLRATAYIRMFSSSLTEDVRLIDEDIDIVSEKIDDPVLCQKIQQFATAPLEIQEIYRKDAGEHCDATRSGLADGQPLRDLTCLW